MQSSKQDSRRKLTLRTAMLQRLQAGAVGEAVVLVSLTSAKTISIRRVALLFSASFLGAAVSMRHGDVALAQAHWAFPVPAQGQGRVFRIQQAMCWCCEDAAGVLYCCRQRIGAGDIVPRMLR